MGRMQLGEFLFIAEWQIPVRALQIGPTMTVAVEDTIESVVDGAVVMWPELHFAVRIHPWMHGCGHQSSARICRGSRWREQCSVESQR